MQLTFVSSLSSHISGTCVPLPKSANIKNKSAQAAAVQAAKDLKFLCPYASSVVVNACLARSCHAILRSVKHCKASPSGSLTGSFCSDTSNDKIVSNLGLRERKHNGHRNFNYQKVKLYSV
jgi:hypothetical protein